MDEDNLIKLIKEKLIARENTKETVVYQHYGQIEVPPDASLFKKCRTLEISHVSIQLMNELYKFEKTPWTDWFFTGLSYQTLFYFEINYFILPFIPWQMLNEWPVEFMISNRKICSFQEKTLTRSMVVKLPENAILVKMKQQKLTEEATEFIRNKKIKVIERSNQSCIWEE